MSLWPSPPPYSLVGKHGVSPQTRHDERARFNFLAQLNSHLAANVLPGNARAYEARAKPAFAHEHGHAPRDRHEVRRAMLKDPHFQMWSALRRSSMELRQQAGREVVLRQLDSLNAAARAQCRIATFETRPRFCRPGVFDQGRSPLHAWRLFR